MPNRAFWASDSQHILVAGDEAARTLTVHALPEMTVAAAAGLPPVTPVSGALVVTGASPDGQWLVGCSIDATDQQSWLYPFPSQAWQRLAQSDDCVHVVGWITP